MQDTYLDQAVADQERRMRRLMAALRLPRGQAEDVVQTANLNLWRSKAAPLYPATFVRTVDLNAARDHQRRERRQRAASAALAASQVMAEQGYIPTKGNRKDFDHDAPLNPTYMSSSDSARFLPGEALHQYETQAEVSEERARLAHEAAEQVRVIADAAGLTELQRDVLVARYGLRPLPWSEIAKRLGTRGTTARDTVATLYQKMIDAAGADVDLTNLIKRASYSIPRGE